MYASLEQSVLVLDFLNAMMSIRVFLCGVAIMEAKSKLGGTEAYGKTVAEGFVRVAEGTSKLTMISFLVV